MWKRGRPGVLIQGVIGDEWLDVYVAFDLEQRHGAVSNITNMAQHIGIQLRG